MRNKLFCWLPILVVVQAGMLQSVQAQGLWAYHHAPYQDQHFNLDSTRRSESGYSTSSESYSNSPLMPGSVYLATSVTCGGGEFSKNGNCPRSNNATLRLWIADEMTVEINGQTTKQQMLAGIHQGSRIFSLEALEFDKVSPCDIIVVTCDDFGQPVRLRHSFAVQAGKSYVVRFPAGFERLATPSHRQPIPMQNLPNHVPLENIDLSEPEALPIPSNF